MDFKNRLTLVLVALLGTIALEAQTPKTIVIEVKETTGIRRTEYPVNARVTFPRGVIRSPTQARLRVDGAEAPAQYSTESRWDDGSVRWLNVDFNVSIGPAEARTYHLEFGSEVAASDQKPRGLSVAEETDGIQVGSVRFNKSGSPLVVSANYRGNFIGQGQNGVAIVDRSGGRHDMTSARGLTVELLKRGPLYVVLRYSGRMPLDTADAVPFTITFEMPNSKSWVKMTAAVDDPGKRVREIRYETPFTFRAHPWTWDFGTDNGTYGALRNPTDSVTLTQRVAAKGPTGWTVQTVTQDNQRSYEASTASRGKAAFGWGHLLDAKAAVAFAVDRFARDPGTYTIALNGQGQAAFAFAPAQPAPEHRLTVYQHFVGTPVPIGAATSPASMINPLTVEVR